MDIKIINSFENWLFDKISKKFDNYGYTKECAGYISNLLNSNINNDNNINSSIVLMYKTASEKNTIKEFKHLGEIIFIKEFLSINFPNDLNIYFGKLCYNKCYILSNKNFEIFDEMSNNFCGLIKLCKEEIINN